MYTAFFEFKENPFNLTPDPRYLFLSRYHREALEHLLYGINERKGFIAITGGIGTGKTTLCRALLDHLDQNTKSALIFSSFISGEEILKTINHEFGIQMDPGASSKKDDIDALNAFLLENFSRGENALLLIDEAQNLSHTVLEQIRMLSNLETEKEKLLQVVLVGQSELKDLLERPSLRQLNERITVRYNLKPLDEADLRGYVQHRLTVAGGKGDVRFPKRALKAVYAYSAGNPRRINAVCDRALLIAFAAEKREVSRRMVQNAIKDLTGRSAAPGIAKRPFKWIVWALAFLFVGIFISGLHLWGSGGALREGFSRITGQNILPPPSRTVAKAPGAQEVAASVFLDGNRSLTALFQRFEKAYGTMATADNGVSLGLVSFNLSGEYFVKFKRPFRVVAVDFPSTLGSGPRYLLITRTTYDGATVLDKEGRLHEMDRAFILRHWGGTVSFVYPQRDDFKTLVSGMKGREVLHVQRTLMQVGYMVEPTGRYDRQTSQAVNRFQRDFGLNPDGIVGPRTMALLFQIRQKYGGQIRQKYGGQVTDPDDEQYP